MSHTACDTPAAVEKSGLVLSEDHGPGHLKVSGYLPGGVQADPARPVASQGEFFEGAVSKSQRGPSLLGRGSPIEVAVPGSK